LGGGKKGTLQKEKERRGVREETAGGGKIRRVPFMRQRQGWRLKKSRARAQEKRIPDDNENFGRKGHYRISYSKRSTARKKGTAVFLVHGADNDRIGEGRKRQKKNAIKEDLQILEEKLSSPPYLNNRLRKTPPQDNSKQKKEGTKRRVFGRRIRRSLRVYWEECPLRGMLGKTRIEGLP